MAEHVEITDYDRAWLEVFTVERDELVGVVGSYLVGTIEHVGSTSVPGLAAKPIVDIQVGVAGLEQSRPTFSVLEAIGYRYSAVRPDVMHSFEKRELRAQSFNLQLIPYRSDCWNRRIAFRDYLRLNPEIAEEYASLKRRLSKDHRTDLTAYNQGKSSFIRSVTERALRAR